MRTKWPRWFTPKRLLESVLGDAPVLEDEARVVHEHVEVIGLVAEPGAARWRTDREPRRGRGGGPPPGPTCVHARISSSAAAPRFCVTRGDDHRRQPSPGPSATAVSLPIPDVPPVTTATRSAMTGNASEVTPGRVTGSLGSMPELVTSERGADGVAVIRLDRPPMNTLSHALLGELGEVARELALDPDVKAVVVAGW